MNSYFQDREKMSEIQRNTLVDKYLVDYVYNAARVEGVPTTFLDTGKFVNDSIVPNLDIEDANKLRNLKQGYKALKDSSFLNSPSDLTTLCRINLIVNGRGVVYEAGQLRIDDVSIGGSAYKPPIPDPYLLNNSILSIVKSDMSDIEKGLELYCFIMRAQPFIDGNKRTGNLFGNHYLLSHGQGIVSIRAEKKDTFFKKLVKFYENGDSSDLKKFMYDKCFYTFDSIPFKAN
jgi:Fic family protein